MKTKTKILSSAAATALMALAPIIVTSDMVGVTTVDPLKASELDLFQKALRLRTVNPEHIKDFDPDLASDISRANAEIGDTSYAGVTRGSPMEIMQRFADLTVTTVSVMRRHPTTIRSYYDRIMQTAPQLSSTQVDEDVSKTSASSTAEASVTT